MHEKKMNKLLGSAYGNAVGDALGAPLEFRDRATCREKFGDGPDMDLGAGTTRTKLPGDYTDDTEMMVAIGRGLVNAQRLAPAAIAEEFYRWYAGHPPDVGCHTSGVLSDIGTSFNDTLDITVYQYSGEHCNGNGSVMRMGLCLPFTIYASDYEAMEFAALQSSLTHPAKQAADWCRAMMLIQRALLQGGTGPESISLAMQWAVKYHFHPKVIEGLAIIVNETIEREEDLPTSGYVKDTMIRALWPIWLEMDFVDGLHAVVMQGGDADSAGAVAGCLLGTRDGVDAIPSKWINAVKTIEKDTRDVTIQDLTTQLVDLSAKVYAPWVSQTYGKTSTGKNT